MQHSPAILPEERDISDSSERGKQAKDVRSVPSPSLGVVEQRAHCLRVTSGQMASEW